MMITIKATIVFEKKYWVGIFERTDKEGFGVARHIFGGEPSDAQIYEFVLTEYQNLKFGQPKGEISVQIKRMNPKRLKRQVKKEMERIKETMRPSTLAQDAMREDLETKKKEKKSRSSAQKQAAKERQFTSKQLKKKEKKKGR